MPIHGKIISRIGRKNVQNRERPVPWVTVVKNVQIGKKKSKLGKGRYHVLIKLGVGKGQRTKKIMKQRNMKGLKFKKLSRTVPGMHACVLAMQRGSRATPRAHRHRCPASPNGGNPLRRRRRSIRWAGTCPQKSVGKLPRGGEEIISSCTSAADASQLCWCNHECSRAHSISFPSSSWNNTKRRQLFCVVHVLTTIQTSGGAWSAIPDQSRMALGR